MALMKEMLDSFSPHGVRGELSNDVTCAEFLVTSRASFELNFAAISA